MWRCGLGLGGCGSTWDERSGWRMWDEEQDAVWGETHADADHGLNMRDIYSHSVTVSHLRFLDLILCAVASSSSFKLRGAVLFIPTPIPS